MIDVFTLQWKAADAAQLALRQSGETYKPSPGQLQDHVHHRVAEICTEAVLGVIADAMLEEDREGWD